MYNIGYIRINPTTKINYIWSPQLYIFNNMGKSQMDYKNGLILLNNGTLIYSTFFSNIIIVPCIMDLVSYPMDHAICTIEMASSKIIKLINNNRF